MESLRVLTSRFLALFRHGRLERELNEDVQAHLEMLVAENLQRGMSPEEARYAARRSFGGVEQTKEVYRSQRSLPRLETLVQDLRFGLRQLRRNPGFTAVAVITLALGIGAATAIFSLVNAVLLKPLPYRDAGRLVAVTDADSQAHSDWATPADFADWQRGNHVFTQMTACTWGAGGAITAGARAGDAMGFYVAANFFLTLGASPLLGRTFVPGDDDERVVVLNYGLWIQQFGGRRDVIGRQIEINHRPFTVIGVMPSSFWFFYRQVALWVPMRLTPAQLASRRSHLLLTFARLKRTVTVGSAQADMDAIARTLSEEYPQDDGGWGVRVTTLRESLLVGETRPALFALLAAVGLLLLIACANVANLLVVRGAARRQELAIRTALGASRSRIVRQVLIEGLLVTALGGAAGLLTAVSGSKLLLAFLPARFLWWMPMLTPGQSLIDPEVFLFAGLIVIVAWMCASLLPAAWSTSFAPHAALKAGAGIAERGGRKARGLMVISEAALTAALLVAAGLLINSFIRIERTQPGFRVDHILTFEIALPRFEHMSAGERVVFFTETLRRIANAPGVTSVGLGDGFGLPPSTPGTPLGVEERGTQTPAEMPRAITRAASSGYFKTLQIPLISGRTFTPADNATAPEIGIVSEDLAHRLWPNENPIGRRMKIGADTTSPWLTIVGVVGETRYQGLTNPPTPSVYLPYQQEPRSRAYIVVRARRKVMTLAPAMRRVVRSVDKAAGVAEMRTMKQIVRESVWQTRFATSLLGLFAALAVLLAAVGIYGVVAFSVAQRTHEIGIRVALGAQKADVLRLIVGQGMFLALVGVGIGIGAALGFTHLLSSLLYGVKPTDPSTFVAVALALTGVALLACWIPARRAADVDPMVALRHE
jgi:putative ABC transport system permease protein